MMSPHPFAARRRGRLALLAVLCAVLPSRVGAQGLTTSLDVGAATVRYADSIDVVAAMVGPSIRYESARATLSASGTYSRSGPNIWTTQGALAGSLFTPRLARLRPELAASAGGSVHQDGTRTGQMLGELRAHLLLGRGGLWLGAGAGRTWDGALWRGLALGDVGAWMRLGGANLVASVTPTVVDDTIRYADTEVGIHWPRERVELSATLGARAGHDLPVVGGRAAVWGSLSGAVWLAPQLAIVASAGSYPVDFVQGYPGGRYASIALRLRARPRAGRPAPTAAGARDIAGAVAADITDFAVQDAGSGRRTLRVRAPRAQRVEVAGDFTNWIPVPLTPASAGWWTTTLPIPSGTHQMNLRLDTRTWIAPPGLARIADEFGGAVGLLILP
jgi:hypothetical protein